MGGIELFSLVYLAFFGVHWWGRHKDRVMYGKRMGMDTRPVPEPEPERNFKLIHGGKVYDQDSEKETGADNG